MSQADNRADSRAESRAADRPRAVVLLSGGLDSTTCLALAREEGFACYTLSLAYGQKHNAELQAASGLSQILGAVEHRLATVDLGGPGGSALTDAGVDVPLDSEADERIPATYVPARNTLMLSLALGWAEMIGADHIFIGVNAVDYSGYPDCRPEYIAAFEQMASLATRAAVEDGRSIRIRTPLIDLSKAEIVALGARLGVDYALTVSCYSADSQGSACGRCDACRFRRHGFEQAGMSDPTRYQNTG